MFATALVIAFAVVGAPGPLDGKYAGGGDMASCKRPQEAQDAPSIIRGRQFDQHEAHCQWGELTAKGKGVWTARGSCTVEGSKTHGAMRFTMIGEKLTVKFPDGEIYLTRCPTK